MHLSRAESRARSCRAVLKVLEQGPNTVAEIARSLGEFPVSVREFCTDLLEEGAIVRRGRALEIARDRIMDAELATLIEGIRRELRERGASARDLVKRFAPAKLRTVENALRILFEREGLRPGVRMRYFFPDHTPVESLFDKGTVPDRILSVLRGSEAPVSRAGLAKALADVPLATTDNATFRLVREGLVDRVGPGMYRTSDEKRRPGQLSRKEMLSRLPRDRVFTMQDVVTLCPEVQSGTLEIKVSQAVEAGSITRVDRGRFAIAGGSADVVAPPRGLHDRVRSIMGADRRPWSSEELQGALGEGMMRVLHALNAMYKAGELRRLGPGRYEMLDSPIQSTEAGVVAGLILDAAALNGGYLSAAEFISRFPHIRVHDIYVAFHDLSGRDLLRMEEPGLYALPGTPSIDAERRAELMEKAIVGVLQAAFRQPGIEREKVVARIGGIEALTHAAISSALGDRLIAPSARGIALTQRGAKRLLRMRRKGTPAIDLSDSEWMKLRDLVPSKKPSKPSRGTRNVELDILALIMKGKVSDPVSLAPALGRTLQTVARHADLLVNKGELVWNGQKLAITESGIATLRSLFEPRQPGKRGRKRVYLPAITPDELLQGKAA